MLNLHFYKQYLISEFLQAFTAFIFINKKQNLGEKLIYYNVVLFFFELDDVCSYIFFF